MENCPPSAPWDKLGRLKKGVFLAHRSVHRSEVETAFQFGEGYDREGRQGHPGRHASSIQSVAGQRQGPGDIDAQDIAALLELPCVDRSTRQSISNTDM